MGKEGRLTSSSEKSDIVLAGRVEVFNGRYRVRGRVRKGT